MFADGAVVDDHTNLARYDVPGASGSFVFDAGHRELEAGDPSLFATAGRFVLVGVEHILLGLDHVLFLLAGRPALAPDDSTSRVPERAA